jgi:hypothetical protein
MVGLLARKGWSGKDVWIIAPIHPGWLHDVTDHHASDAVAGRAAMPWIPPGMDPARVMDPARGVDPAPMRGVHDRS